MATMGNRGHGQGRNRGRRGIGSANRCMHGKDAVIEEILDWRPYDYVTDRTILDATGGPVKLLHTVELEPTGDGTTIHFRFGAPKTPREKEAMKLIGPAYEEALRAHLPDLIAQLDQALAVRDPAGGHEPELPTPNPGGPLS